MTTDEFGRAAASEYTAAKNKAVLDQLPFEDTSDFDRIKKGFIGTFDSLVVTHPDGDAVWDMDQYAFVDGEAPAEVNPSLWRQERLNNFHGLFKVCDGIYQIRGYDVSNVSFVETNSGWIVIDPLSSLQPAHKARELLERELGVKPFVAVIYSHSHVDHFGGVKAFVSEEDVTSGRVKIIAPEGFMEHTVKENVFSGPIMGRRAQYQFGSMLNKDVRGFVGSGVGKSFSNGDITLLAPTDTISKTGTEMVVDGVRILFQNVPGTEAPAEMHFGFPDLKAVCIAENCAASIHNLLTMRGAQIRDALAWSEYLDEAVEIYKGSESLFMSHNWPRWGAQEIVEYIEKQRDVYRFLHDQTLRLANQGYNMVEIAEAIKLPPELGNEFFARGYYGTVSHNTKAVFQKYLGWWDGNPSRLHQLPPVPLGKRYVDAIGGMDRVLEIGRKAVADGDYRWAGELLSHAVHADEDNREARELLAQALEQMGYQAESGIWRGFYLAGAKELRDGITESGGATIKRFLDVIHALPIAAFLDALGTHVNPEKVQGKFIKVNWEITDTGDVASSDIRNCVLHHREGVLDPEAQATLKMTRAVFDAMNVDAATALSEGLGNGDAAIDGDEMAMFEFLGCMDVFPIYAPIVTPRAELPSLY